MPSRFGQVRRCRDAVPLEISVEPIYFPPEDTTSRVGDIVSERYEGRLVMDAALGAKSIHHKTIRSHLGGIALPLFQARVDSAKRHIHADMQYFAYQAAGGYPSPARA